MVVSGTKMCHSDAMDLTPYVAAVHRDLVGAAQVGGEPARALAEQLAGTLDAALRVAFLEALSAAADEVSRALAPGAVELVLRGGVPHCAVTPPPGPPEDEAPPEPDADLSLDGPALRINVRLPEHLKLRVEQAAKREGLSTNTWLVRAAAAALGNGTGRRTTRRSSGEDHVTGWLR